MPFQHKFKIPFKAPKAPAEGWEIERDKVKGTVTVKIHDKAISVQRADSLARGMFVVPVKIHDKHTEGGVQVRNYEAVGWNTQPS